MWRRRRGADSGKEVGAPWVGPLPAVSGCDCRVCRPDDDLDERGQRTVRTVLQHGWQVTLVSDSAGCSCPGHEEHADHEPSGEPDFAYTVGLGHRAGHPELLMSGLDPGLMHRALNDVARRVLDGRRLAPGDVLEGVLGRVPVVIERLADEALQETVGEAAWFHRRVPAALVVVWPTTSGVFAWQPGAPDSLDELQPRRWREPMVHAGGVAIDPEWVFPVPADRMGFSCTHVVDDGEPVRWVSRESDPSRGEDWTVTCGADDHPKGDLRVLHLAHLVRSAPSLRDVADLALDEGASRVSVDAPWVRVPLA